MKSRLLLIPAMLAMTVTLADASSPPADAQAQAAALLAPRHVSGASNVDGQARSSSPRARAPDAQASAAALLSGVRTRETKVSSEIARPITAHTPQDAHSRAAALLSGGSVSTDPRLAAQRQRSGRGISASGARGVGISPDRSSGA
jgi:hypothetical protein